MNYTNTKILKRIAVIVSAAAICTGIVFCSYRYMDKNAVRTIGSVQNDKPVIVLDAGHGERS